MESDVWANASPAQFDLDDQVTRLLLANSSLGVAVPAPPAAGGGRSSGGGSASRDATFAALTERIRQRKTRADGASATSSLHPVVHVSRHGSVDVRGGIPPPRRTQPPLLSPEHSSGGSRSVSY